MLSLKIEKIMEDQKDKSQQEIQDLIKFFEKISISGENRKKIRKFRKYLICTPKSKIWINL